MTNQNQAEYDLKHRLLTSAAEIGRQMQVESEADAKYAKDASVRLGDAKAGARDAGRTLAGFATPMFRGLASLGGLLASDNTVGRDMDSPLAQSIAAGMAESFMSAFTGATDKTKAGGTVTGYVATIRTGHAAERIRSGLQNRLEHWTAKLDSVDGLNDEDSKAIRETAKRYTVQPGPSLDSSGNWPTRNDKDGNPIPYAPKFLGRVACTINGIDLPHRGATDRKAMLAAAARLYASHGDAMLHPDVLDAILDNGGRYTPPADESVKGLASAAREAINKVLLAGANASADAAGLQIAAQLLGMIAENGLTESVVAPTVGTTIPSEPDESVDSNPIDSDVPAPDAAPTVGEPIALGKPAGGGKRARKGGAL